MKKILIVEDQASIRQLMRFTLQSRYAVAEAVSAEEAYGMIAAELPDAVITDVMMPGSMDGFQLCEKLRHEDGLWALPVIILTTCTQQKDRLAGTRAGADIYMTKPFSPAELLTAVDSLLG